MAFIDSIDQQFKHHILLAHGAGADASSNFMAEFKRQISLFGIGIIRFNFPYMEIRLETQTKRPPDRMPKLIESFNAHLDLLSDLDSIWIGGKSMGGRVASHISNHPRSKGVIALGFPFHPAKKPVGERIDHLSKINKPMLIIQGERDALGNKTEVNSYTLDKKIQIQWISDGDHSFKPRKSSGHSFEDNIATAAKATADFIAKNTV